MDSSLYYADTLREVSCITANLPRATSDEYKLKVLTDLHVRLAAPDTERTLIDEINDLVYGAFQIHASFNQISAAFRTVLVNGPSSSLIVEMNALIALWDELYTASSTDFAFEYSTLFADDSVPLEDKQREIAYFIKQIQRDENVATAVAEAFVDYRGRVDAAQGKWRDIVRRYRLPYDAAQISATDNSFTLLNEKICLLSTALGISHTTGGVESFFVRVVPRFWSECLISATGMNTSPMRVQRPSAHSGVGKLWDDISVSSMPQISSNVTSTLGEFDTILQRLEAFPGVWSMIRSDMMTIEERFGYASDTASERLFKARLRVLATLYDTLRKALQHYYTVLVEVL
ncbi:hypothetical protein EUX98_g8756 [Antrodiella citrinella]|uniref:Uncharacterized protein n=1 Tax=Antrodiella citrinella TaxID=2447956 RepID=A0A4S4M357_9APHY|nr:hypothetical protein EUX98_g8756 [Antrodiella citrinella]